MNLYIIGACQASPRSRKPYYIKCHRVYRPRSETIVQRIYNSFPRNMPLPILEVAAYNKPEAIKNYWATIKQHYQNEENDR